MARGGRRQGRTGANYTNRSDLQAGPRLPVQAPSGQQYGTRKALEDQQRGAPMLRQTPAVAPATMSAAPPTPPMPLDAPTARPDEPITAGAPFGPGPGPEVLGLSGMDGTADELRALYRMFPNDDLRRLIEVMDGR